MNRTARQIFGQADYVARLYIIIFVMITFSGATWVRNYVPHLMLIEGALAASMAVVYEVKRNAFLNLRYWAGYVFLAVFDLYLWGQIGMSYTPVITKVYAVRFVIYCVLLVFVAKPAITYCCIQAMKGYSLVVAVSIIGESVLTGGKAGGLVGDYQSAGMMMSIAAILFLLDLYDEKKDYFNMFGLFLCLCGVLISGKRMFTLIIGISFVLIYGLSRAKGKKKKFYRLMIVMIFAGGLLFFFVPATHEVINRMKALSGSTQSMTSGRNVLWQVAMEIYREHPLFGIGFGAFKTYFEDHYVFSGIQAFLTHNIYYGLLSETGLIGTTLYVGFMAVSLMEALFCYRRVRLYGTRMQQYILNYAIALQIWYILYGFTGNGIYDANESFFYTMAIAMVSSLKLSMENCETVVIA